MAAHQAAPQQQTADHDAPDVLQRTACALAGAIFSNDRWCGR
jgi:hypothetical protein